MIQMGCIFCEERLVGGADVEMSRSDLIRKQIAVLGKPCVEHNEPPVSNRNLGGRAGEGIAHAEWIGVRQGRVIECVSEPAFIDAGCARTKGKDRDDAGKPRAKMQALVLQQCDRVVFAKERRARAVFAQECEGLDVCERMIEPPADTAEQHKRAESAFQPDSRGKHGVRVVLLRRMAYDRFPCGHVAQRVKIAHHEVGTNIAKVRVSAVRGDHKIAGIRREAMALRQGADDVADRRMNHMRFEYVPSSDDALFGRKRCASLYW